MRSARCRADILLFLTAVAMGAAHAAADEITLSTGDAVLCHVNMKTRFTERKPESYRLDPGTYDWREQEIIIEPERPLRSIQLSLYLWKCPGTVWVDEISVTPVKDPLCQYVVDPSLDQWYDRPAAEHSKEVDSRFSELEVESRELLDAAGTLVDRCLSILDGACAHRKWIEQAGLENPCRRALRELDDLTARLSLIGSTLMGLSGPHVDAPTTAVGGEEIAVEVRVDGVQPPHVRYTL